MLSLKVNFKEDEIEPLMIMVAKWTEQSVS